MATAARQLPWVGRALNWQGQPQSQLQVASSGPFMLQSTKAMRTPPLRSACRARKRNRVARQANKLERACLAKHAVGPVADMGQGRIAVAVLEREIAAAPEPAAGHLGLVKLEAFRQTDDGAVRLAGYGVPDRLDRHLHHTRHSQPAGAPFDVPLQ